MPWNCQPISDALLRPAPSHEHYRLHLAALEWSLAEAIIIHDKKDILSRGKWRDGFDPYEHQVKNLSTFCRRLPVTLLADDVGLGKTISAGLILSELMVRRRVRRALVLCPSILCPQWVRELGSKFGIPAKLAIGKQLDEELRGQMPVVVSTYESARERLKTIAPDAFEMLILDEAHKLKNLYGSSKPPALARSVRLALASRSFKYVVMLTATPIHNRIWDLYSLVDCLTVAKGHKNPFGEPDEFKRKYLLPRCNGRRLQKKTEIQTEFRGFVREYLVRTRRGDAQLKFPTREVSKLRVDLSGPEGELSALVKNQIEKLNPLQQTLLAQALMSSPHALAVQLEGMAERGRIDVAVANKVRAIADQLEEPAKLKGLLSILEELRLKKPKDWRCVVFTHRKETQKLIGNTLQRRGITVGFVTGDEARQNEAAIEHFTAAPPGIHVLVSTDAGAEGVNLQAANFLVNYDLPWNPMKVKQRIGRIQRLGSEHGHVIVCNLVAADSAEERVVCRLMEKLQGIAEAIGDIESILESTNGDEKEPEKRFENQIRRLVIQSLLGQNVEEATRLAQENIERARQLIETQRREMDIVFGSPEGPQRSKLEMPQLSRISREPEKAKRFVLDAKRAEGFEVEERPDGRTYSVRRERQILEVIKFEEGDPPYVFMGIPLYEWGSTAFERLVQHWLDRCGHFVRDLRSKTAGQVEALARAWCQTIPESEFQTCAIESRRSWFQGRVHLKVKALNGVDSYEKLLEESIQPPGHSPMPLGDGTEDIVRADLRPQEVVRDLSAPVLRKVETDEDVGKFCTFYEERREEEMKRAEKVEGADRRKHKIDSDFTPSVAANLVALEGTRYEEVTILIRFTIEGKGPYEATVAAIPASGQILQEPPKARCTITELSVPGDCLAACAVSGGQVLRHRLVKSEASERWALPRHIVRCAVTNKKVFSDEVETSDLSGGHAIRDSVRRSPASGRWGLPDEFERCEITGKEVLRDELIRSEVSAKQFIECEKTNSVVSGTLGHKSEFVFCAKTGSPILPEESGTSDRSGKVVRKDLLRPSENPPHRLGLEEEFGVCEKTDKRLLLDELGRSAVSGKWVDRTFLRLSARSGKQALEAELVECAESKIPLVPEETDYCSVSGKRVDTRLLSQSAVSGKRGLTRLMERCAATRESALPGELEKCSLSEEMVLPRLLESCAVTGKRVLRDRMLRSSVSGEYVLPSCAVHSAVSGAVCLPDEAVQCAWLQKPILKREAGYCALTKMEVDARLLDEAGELRVLRHLLDGRTHNVEARDDLLPLLQSLKEGVFRPLRHVWGVAAPEGKSLAVCGELRSLFGLRVRYVGFLLQNDGERQIIGRYSIGSRNREGWTLEKQS